MPPTIYLKDNPIYIIDDDRDDLDLIEECLKGMKLKNELFIFEISSIAFDHLKSSIENPFFILCDVNMPIIDGFALRQKIYDDEKLRMKSIPFLFLSTSVNELDLEKAYKLNVQGYFLKPSTLEGIKNMLTCITSYWGNCLSPHGKFLSW